MTKQLEAIAKQYLRVDTLETRNNDNLDFYDISVWGLKAALEAAYKAGQESIKNKLKPNRKWLGFLRGGKYDLY